MSGNPGVDTRGQPRETGSHEQRANRTPYKMTRAQRRGDCGVTAGHLTVLADPLHRR